MAMSDQYNTSSDAPEDDPYSSHSECDDEELENHMVRVCGSVKAIKRTPRAWKCICANHYSNQTGFLNISGWKWTNESGLRRSISISILAFIFLCIVPHITLAMCT